MEKAAVTAVCWVPRGRCNPRRPEAAEEVDENETPKGGASSSSAVANALRVANAVTQGLEEFDLDNYDAEDDEGMQFFSVLNVDGELAREKDPHVHGGPDSESDDDFCEVKPEDQLFVAVSCEEDNCQLELYVFEEEVNEMYVHHEVLLTAYPLCVEWLCSAGTAGEGSFAAVGSIDHSIHLWDLEELEPLDPVRTLGAVRKPPKGKTKNRRHPLGMSGAKAHDGPVLCLHGSAFNRSVLASGSADEVLKVWDVTENKCVHNYTHHSNKVQCVRWHPTEQAVLLSAAFDRRLALLDVRQPGQAATTELPAEAECAIWSRHQPFECIASVDSGGVACYDVRKIVSKATEEQKLWTVLAYDVACTAVQDAPTKGMMVTAGLDGCAKVWKVDPNPTMVFTKDLKAGPLFTCQSSAEAPALMCFGGRCPVMWDLTSQEVLLDAFGLAAAADT